MHYVAALAAGGPHQATAQGLAESLRALGGICANLLGGVVMDGWGARALYGASAVCVGAALSLYLIATCLTPGSRAGRPCEPSGALAGGGGGGGDGDSDGVGLAKGPCAVELSVAEEGVAVGAAGQTAGGASAGAGAAAAAARRRRRPPSESGQGPQSPASLSPSASSGTDLGPGSAGAGATAAGGPFGQRSR